MLLIFSLSGFLCCLSLSIVSAILGETLELKSHLEKFLSSSTLSRWDLTSSDTSGLWFDFNEFFTVQRVEYFGSFVAVVFDWWFAHCLISYVVCLLSIISSIIPKPLAFFQQFLQKHLYFRKSDKLISVFTHLVFYPIFERCFKSDYFLYNQGLKVCSKS